MTVSPARTRRPESRLMVLAGWVVLPGAILALSYSASLSSASQEPEASRTPKSSLSESPADNATAVSLSKLGTPKWKVPDSRTTVARSLRPVSGHTPSLRETPTRELTLSDRDLIDESVEQAISAILEEFESSFGRPFRIDDRRMVSAFNDADSEDDWALVEVMPLDDSLEVECRVVVENEVVVEDERVYSEQNASIRCLVRSTTHQHRQTPKCCPDFPAPTLTAPEVPGLAIPPRPPIMFRPSIID